MMAMTSTPTATRDGASFVSGADQNEVEMFAPSWKTQSFEYVSWKPSSEGENSQQDDVLSKEIGAQEANLNVTALMPDYSGMLQMQVPDGQYYVPVMMMEQTPMMFMPMMDQAPMMPMMEQAPMMASPVMTMQPAPMMVMAMPQQCPSDMVGNTAPAPRTNTTVTTNTTVMWRNIPNNYSRDDLLALIDSQGFAGSYDFFYSPLDFSSNALVGYAFVNFVSSAEADRFFYVFQGFKNWSLKSEKTSQVTWSQPLQGLNGHIERYRNSAVMHPQVSDDKKPVLFNQGQRIPFPMPTKAIRAPHLKECRPRE